MSEGELLALVKDLPSQLAEIGAAAQTLAKPLTCTRPVWGLCVKGIEGPGFSPVEEGGDH